MTRALLGEYTSDGSWRAVWVHKDGAPEALGARLVRAVELHGGDATTVLAHAFSTKGWTSWPDQPHHPDDPDDVVVTRSTVLEDVHWYYLFAPAGRRLDIIRAGAGNMTPDRQILFGSDGMSDHELGRADLTLMDLKPVVHAWRRRCPEPLASALGAIFDDLGLGKSVGINMDPTHGTSYELQVGARTVHVEAFGKSWHDAFWSDGEPRAFPDLHAWDASRVVRWRALCDALGMELEPQEDGSLAHFRTVVDRAEDRKREMTLSDAQRLGGFEFGDVVGEIRRAHMVWNWLFDQAWAAAEPSPQLTRS